MRIVSRIIAMSRTARLNREFRMIKVAVDELPHGARQTLATLTLRELANASRCAVPHLYGTPPEECNAAMWGTGNVIGLERARSDNVQVRMRGIALWLAVVFHETRDVSDSANVSPTGLHGQILSLLHHIKQNLPDDATAGQWNDTVHAAA